MNLQHLIKNAGKFATDNSPLILTAVGAVGVVTTAYLSGRAGFKAGTVVSIDYMDRLVENDSDDVTPLTLKETFNLTWKCYIPPALTATVTVASIIGANKIGMRRAAAMTTALALSEKAFDEYRNKVVEKIGEKKANVIRDEIVQNQMDENPIGRNEIIVTGNGDVNCYEAYTGRYFKSNIETMKHAQNAINYMVNNEGHASLSDFYDKIGLSHTDASDDLGWRSDVKLLELEFVGHIDENGQPVIGVIYQTVPTRNYWKFRG